ncbi:major facilitator superfamily transporter protein [Clarireedia jacksonii]
MVPKQYEMDGIVRQIYENMESKDYLSSTLLILCGDHGMNDAGNHGGSSPGETSPALVFISPKFKDVRTKDQELQVPAPFEEEFQYYKTVEQSDIAPTLAALLGFPVPRNNLGTFIDDFLVFWPKKNDRIQILLRNARQILGVVTATFPSFESEGPSENCQTLSHSVDNLACQWRGITKGLHQLQNDGENYDWLKEAQDLMSGTASNYDVGKLLTGQAVAGLAFVMATATAWPFFKKSFRATFPFIIICLLYSIMMFASSYVEEEQHFWYWTSSAWLFLSCVGNVSRQSRFSRRTTLLAISILTITRIARRWNQTGQKFAGDPDIARTFFSQHRWTLWNLVAITYLWNLQSLASKGFSRFPQVVAGIISTLLTTTAVTFKLAFTYEDSPELLAGFAKSIAQSDNGISLVLRARLVFIGIACALLYTILASSGSSNTTSDSKVFGRKRSDVPTRTIHDLFTLFLITQSRATNIPLILLFDILFKLLSTLSLSLIEISTTILLLQHFSFFAFGNSNAISSVDLSSAYNGVDSYNILAVGILTFVSNWAGPLFCASAGNLLLLNYWNRASVKRKFAYITGSDRTKYDIWTDHISFLTVFVTCSLAATMVACTVLRTHLFIWTVFSPKFLYTMAWSVGMHLGGNILLGGLLFRLGRALGGS